MVTRIIAPFMLFASLLIALIGMLLYGPFAESVYYFIPGNFEDRHTWFPLVHTVHNAFSTWRIDPLLHGIYTYTGSKDPGIPAAFVFISLMAQALGTWCILNLSYGRGRLLFNAALSIAFPTLLLCLWGNDIIIISSLCWFPWLILAILIALHYPERQLQGTLVAVYFSYRLSLGACLLAPVYVVSALLIAFALKRDNHLSRFMNDSAMQHILMILAVLLPPCMSLFFVEGPTFPAYDTLSHVVPDDGVAGNVLPLIGPSPPIPVMYRTLITEQLCYPLLVLSVLFGISLLQKTKGSLWKLSFGLWILLVLDILLPESFSQLAPLSVLERTIPYQFFLPLNHTVMAILFFIMIIAWPTMTGLLIALLSCITAGTLHYYYPQSRGLLIPEESNRAVAEYHERVAKKQYDEESSLFIAQRLASPSHHILKTRGLIIMDLEHYIAQGVFRSLRRLESHLESSDRNDPKELHNMIRRIPHTRWYAGGGTQEGDEWVHLWVEKPLLIHGIELSTEEFHTDFPRGIRISYKSQCTKSKNTDTAFTKIFEQEAWDGPPGITADRYPYLGSQGIVKLYFDHEILAQCLMIEQIGTSIHYDWSIARLRLLPVDANERL